MNGFKKIEDEPHDLYRHFDEQGNLLYIGISLSTISRLAQHKNGSAWYEDIRRVEIERHPNRRAALRAERKAIIAEKPIHNIAHNCADEKPDTKKSAQDFIQVDRSRLINLLISQYWYTEQQAREVLGCSGPEVIALFESGDLPGFTWIHEYDYRGEPKTKRKYKFSVWQLLEYLDAQHAIAERERPGRKVKCS